MGEYLKKNLNFFGKDHDESKPAASYDEDRRKLAAGEEIEPPWIKYSPTLSPWEMRHDFWLTDIWLVFWRTIDEQKREAYKEKWNMPPDWDEVVTMFWTEINQTKNIPPRETIK